MKIKTMRRLSVRFSALVAVAGVVVGIAATAASADPVYSHDAVYATSGGTNVKPSIAGFWAGLDSAPYDGIPIANFEDVPASDLAGFPDSDYLGPTTKSNTDGQYKVTMVCADGFTYTGPTQVWGVGTSKALVWPTVAQRMRLDPAFVAHLRSVKPGGTDASINGCQLYPHTPKGRYIGGGVEVHSADYGVPPGVPFINDTATFHVASVQLSGPTIVNLGTVAVGSTGDLTIDLSNPNPDQLVFTGSVRLTGGKGFQIASDNCPGATISGVEACAVVVTFSPKRVGIQNADLTFRQDNVTHSVQLSGIGSAT